MMSDTTPAMEQRYREMLMELPPERRLIQSCRMFTTAKRLAEASIRSGQAAGQADDETIRRELFLRFYRTDVPDRLRKLVLQGRHE
jgi:hypothetical protein